jgi:hypothetical protein
MYSGFSGVMVNMFVIGSKVHGFRPSHGEGFLRVIKIHSMPSFGGELKLLFPCRKILWHVKNHFEL